MIIIKQPLTRVARLLILLLLLSIDCQAVLTGFEGMTDVTELREFGCRWLGGSESKLVCHCQGDAREMVIEETSIPARDIGTMSISNCRRVRFMANSISRMRNLRYIELRDSGLSFSDYSFLWEGYVLNNNQDVNYMWEFENKAVPTLNVIIDRCNISHIGSFSFQGKISDISITNSDISNIEPFAFSGIKFNANFRIVNTNIVTVQPQALKKFATSVMTVESVSFDVIPSRAWSEVIVRDQLLLKNVTARRVRSSAFTISGPKKTDILNGHFDVVEGGAFRLYTRGGVTIANNYLGNVNDYAFKEISVELDQVSGTQYISFTNNTISEFYRDSLSVNKTSFEVKYKDVILRLPCDCVDINRLFARQDNLEQFACIFNGEITVMSEFKQHKCTILSSHSNMIIIIGVTAIVLVLVLIGLALYFKKVYRCGSYGGEENNKEKSLALIVPDGRTYRETELHVIVERTDMLTTDL